MERACNRELFGRALEHPEEVGTEPRLGYAGFLAEVSEAITHLAFYVGWPNAFSALPVAKDVFEKRPR